MMTESLLNTVFNKGGFNRPNRIGSVMAMIRLLHPDTEQEWREWYLTNAHNETYLNALAAEMQQMIPGNEGISAEDCRAYIEDVIFRRTFEGYANEQRLLTFLRENVSPNVEESPEEWDAAFFIDFYVYSDSGTLLGVQLKPESFYAGHFERVVDIDGRLREFRRIFHAGTFVLLYRTSTDKSISITNHLTLLSLRLAVLDVPVDTDDVHSHPP